MVDIYTDGACSGNPGPGGWGVVILLPQSKKQISGSENETTNQRMELMAVIKALEVLNEPTNVKIHTDSAYVMNAFEQNWFDNWQKNGWKNSRGKPVANRDLWQRLLDLVSQHEVEWVKVKGHSGDKYNEEADRLAKEAIGQ